MPTYLAALMPLLCGLAFGMTSVQNASQPNKALVAELFEDDADELLKLLTNPGDGPGKGEAEAAVVFSGKKSLKITDYQRFHRTLPGWNYAIKEKPKVGEYRFLRFAWKSGGANCLMLQVHDATDWHIRYTAGPNPYGWQTRFVADKAPVLWTVVTVDLFKDFGERTLTGMAFTIHGGAGYFDHVYLGRSIDDLDRIDANELAKKELALEKKDLEGLWQGLLDEDAAKQYRAFWTLVGGRDRSTSFIKGKIAPAKLTDAADKQLRELIRNLNSGNFTVREKATAELRKRIDSALPILEAELAGAPSVEMRRRIEALIADAPPRDRDRLRRVQAIRILDYIDEFKRKS